MAYWKRSRRMSVAQKMARITRKIMMQETPGLRPVRLQGNIMAKTWWGKSWNKNLERYADYNNRIGRGRSYLRHGALLDLQIGSGQVKALVQGSRLEPYSVVIRIEPLKKGIWEKHKVACESRLESLQELLSGQFPKSLEEIFMRKEKGLFPSPKEISFSCSCPDWADMCKHVAASLYGIGSRLDEEPQLFFKIRQVNVDDLVTQALEDSTSKLLKKAEKKSKKVLDDSRLSELFGIDMEGNPAPKPIRKKTKPAKEIKIKQTKKSSKKVPSPRIK